MALKYGDRVQETITTTGTGSYSLGGAVTGYQAFSSVLSNADTCYYAATDGTNWEVGLGTFTSSGSVLARTTILSSSNSGSAVSWSAGTKNIWLDFPAFIAAQTVPAANAISGCLITSLAGNHTTASATITSGQAADSTNAAYINSAGYSWLASNGNAINGTDAGSSTLANSTTYHMFLCSGASGTGTFCSASLTPTFPTGYTTYTRRIGSFTTTAAGAPIPYTSIEGIGGATTNYLTTQKEDVNATLSSANRTLYPLTIPTGVKMGVLGRAYSPSASLYIILTSPDETDVAPASTTAVPGWDAFGGQNGASSSPLITDTSARIGIRGSTTSTAGYTTRGWIDFRRS